MDLPEGVTHQELYDVAVVMATDYERYEWTNDNYVRDYLASAVARVLSGEAGVPALRAGLAVHYLARLTDDEFGAVLRGERLAGVR